MPRSRYTALMKLYESWYGPLDHSLFMEVGKSLQANTYFTLKELWQVAYWKVGSARNDGRIMKNKDRVEEITRGALKPDLSDAQRLEELYNLEGVGTPVASALLTVWNPKDFAIIDRMVWKLCTGRKWIRGPRSCDDTSPYLTFLEFIRAQRDELGGEWTAREVEEALYALAEELE